MIDFKQGVSLGPIDKSDLALLRKWRNDRSIWRWARQNDLLSEVDQEKWFEKNNSDPSMKMYMIMADDGRVGVCGFSSIDLRHRAAEFSIYIAPNKQACGFGRKGLKTLISHGFKNLGLNCIWGESFEGNPAIKLFEEIGFKRDGVRRCVYYKEGKFINSHMFSLLASEWK